MKRAICLASIALLLSGCCGVSKGFDRCIISQGNRLAAAPRATDTCALSIRTADDGPEVSGHGLGPS